MLSLYICQYLSASSKSKEEEKKNAMKKNVIRTITAAVLAASLAGCGSASTAASGSASADSSDKVIKVGASSTPHAEILNNVVKDVLAEDGWTLEVT